MLTNLSNYRMVTTAAGKHSFSRVTPSKEQSSVYTTAKPLEATASVKNPHETTAFYGNFNVSSYPQGVNMASPTSGQNNYTGFLDGFVDTQNTNSLRLKYKDMYYFDNICGTAADLRSELPFSEYTLTGVSDPKVLEHYQAAMDELKPIQFLRRLLADYFVFGSVAYAMIFDDTRGYFLSPVPLNLENCTFLQTPLLNDAPFIDYTMDEGMKDFVKAYNTGDARVKDYLGQRPGLLKLIAANTGQKLQLDPETTLYLERNDLSYSPKTTVSYYARALKYYEYEKRIFRGTIDLSEKRLKSILHLMIGNDNILPTSDTLAEISNAFKTANLDPTDAIVATHNYVQTNEIRQPTDFWRWDEISDFTNRGKMIALGINEQFLSGDISYASLESALSVFLDQLLWDRTYVTDRVFYKTLFPYIAKENGFISEEDRQRVQEVVESRDIKLNPFLQEKEVHQKMQYQIPSIMWHKALKPRVDKDWMETLSTLEDREIPIPYRMWLTAAGIDAEELMQEYETDGALEDAAEGYKSRMDNGAGLNDLEDQHSDYNPAGDSQDYQTEDEIPAEEAEEEPDMFATPETEEPKEQLNPKLFEGSGLKRIGVRGRSKLGDLNNPEVNARFAPRVSLGNGQTREMSKRELSFFNEEFNKKLSRKLAEKDEREVKLENNKYNAAKSKIIV